MGAIHFPPKVKLITGFISSEKELFAQLEKILIKKFAEIDFHSPVFAFTHTQYYEAELGKNLLRKFVSFRKLINPARLSEIKIYTNKLESKFQKSLGMRRINIDPGYLTESKLILATTKNYSHRIYLTKGIYAEVTLFYKDNKFSSWPWTYPDYKSEEYAEVFKNIRALYLKQLKEK